MSAKRKMGTTASILSYVIIALVILAGIGFLIYFTNGLTTDFQTFYVKTGETVIRQNTRNFVLTQDRENRFEVRSSLGAKVEYQVEVFSYAEDDNEFVYLVDGKAEKFMTGQDFTRAFEISIFDGYFIIQWTEDMKKILQAYYPDRELAQVPDIQASATDYFVLIVTVAERELQIAFHGDDGVRSVTLSPDKIIC